MKNTKLNYIPADGTNSVGACIAMIQRKTLNQIKSKHWYADDERELNNTDVLHFLLDANVKFIRYAFPVTALPEGRVYMVTVLSLNSMAVSYNVIVDTVNNEVLDPMKERGGLFYNDVAMLGTMFHVVEVFPRELAVTDKPTSLEASVEILLNNRAELKNVEVIGIEGHDLDMIKTFLFVYKVIAIIIAYGEEGDISVTSQDAIRILQETGVKEELQGKSSASLRRLLTSEVVHMKPSKGLNQFWRVRELLNAYIQEACPGYTCEDILSIVLSNVEMKIAPNRESYFIRLTMDLL